jgi:hypothetical protein
MANNELKNPIKATKAELSARQKQLKVIYDLPKVNLDDDKAVEERINFYFNYSAEQGIKPSIEGLALAIGIDRRTLWDWESGNTRAQFDSSRSDMIKKAKDYIAFLMSDAALENKIFPATWIFYAKNYFGMSDKQEIEIKANQPLGDELSWEEIEKKLPDKKCEPIDVEFTEE